MGSRRGTSGNGTVLSLPLSSDAGRQYREESDTLGRFIAECCEVRALAQVKASTSFKRYKNFCEQAGERWIPAKDYPTEMRRRTFTYKRDRTGTRLYHGLELASARDWRVDDDA